MGIEDSEMVRDQKSKSAPSSDMILKKLAIMEKASMSDEKRKKQILAQKKKIQKGLT